LRGMIGAEGDEGGERIAWVLWVLYVGLQGCSPKLPGLSGCAKLEVFGLRGTEKFVVFSLGVDSVELGGVGSAVTVTVGGAVAEESFLKYTVRRRRIEGFFSAATG